MNGVGEIADLEEAEFARDIAIEAVTENRLVTDVGVFGFGRHVVERDALLLEIVDDLLFVDVLIAGVGSLRDQCTRIRADTICIPGALLGRRFGHAR